jgi:hypothetical protein
MPNTRERERTSFAFALSFDNNRLLVNLSIINEDPVLDFKRVNVAWLIFIDRR